MFLKRQTIAKKNLFTLLLLSCFTVNEIACTKLIKETNQPSELKVPVESKILITKILTKSSDRLVYFKDLKALAEIAIKFSLKKIKRKNVVHLRNDPALRFEVLSISGKPFIYFTVNSLQTSIYYPDNNTIYRGASSPKNIARIIGTDIELNNIFTILSGNFKIPSKVQKIELYENKDFYLMTFYFKNNETKNVFVDKENYLPSMIEYQDSEGDLISIQYADYKQIDKYFLPFVINIKRAEKNQEIDIRYKKVSLNQGVSDSSFTIPTFRGVKILPLENN